MIEINHQGRYAAISSVIVFQNWPLKLIKVLLCYEMRLHSLMKTLGFHKSPRDEEFDRGAERWATTVCTHIDRVKWDILKWNWQHLEAQKRLTILGLGLLWPSVNRDAHKNRIKVYCLLFFLSVFWWPLKARLVRKRCKSEVVNFIRQKTSLKWSSLYGKSYSILPSLLP